jgi:ferric-dicitrate binding protein FerR (iron transport regulator)
MNMADAKQAGELSANDAENFTVLVLRYLESGCSAAEIEQLKRTLEASALHRAQFVRTCRLQGELHEVFAARRAEMQLTPASAAQRAGAEGRLPIAHGSAPGAAATDDLAFTPELSGEPGSTDPGADTVVRELSGEDTIHPTPRPPEA